MFRSRSCSRFLSAVFAALLTILFSNCDTFASQTRVLLGPEMFARTNASTDIYTRSFLAPSYVSSPYTLHIKNGNPASGANKVAIGDAVSSASVWINGVKVVAESEFSKTVAYIDKTIALNQTNTLEIRLNSAPNSYITVTISGAINLGSLNQYRSGHTANLLSDGRVLIAGGNNNTDVLSSAEIFDPQTLSFTPSSNNLITPRTEHTATLLPDSDTMLIAGRDSIGGLFTAELFDLSSGTFTEVNNPLKNLRTAHTSTLLPDGKILIIGGADGSNITLQETELFDPKAAVIFDPKTGSFDTLPNSLSTPRENHTATLMPDGKVLIIGGKNGSGVLSSVEIFDSNTQAFIFFASALNKPRYGHTATLLPDGRVLILGGSDGSSILSSAEIYDPNTSAFTLSSNSLNTSRFNHTATLLPYGEILITGGEDQSGILSTAEFFGPPAKDTTAPTVLAAAPASGAKDVDPNTIISMSFSEPVDVRTLSSSHFTLAGPQGVVNGTVSTGESGLLAFFVPSATLSYGTTYTISLSSEIKDTSGNPLTLYTSQFITSAVPLITGFSPATATAGTQVTITGINFDATAAVFFNGTQASVSSVTSTTIIASVPDGAATGPITVTTRGGAAASSENFTVIYLPVITGFTPSKGTVGTVVTINGKNFNPSNTRVKFNGTDAVITAITSSAISTTVPLGASTGPVTVSTDTGTAQSSNNFTVILRNDFSLAVGPSVSTALGGKTAYFSISIESAGAEPFTGLVKLSASGLPSGITASFNPEYASTTRGSVLSLQIQAGAAEGSYTFTIAGASSVEGRTETRTADARLNILAQGTTGISGRIMDSFDGRPIPNVTIRLGSVSAATDAAGYFLIVNPPSGNQVLIIDGHTANTAAATYASDIPVPVAITQGQANDLPYPIYLHRVNTKTYTYINNNAAQDIKVTDPSIPYFEMTVPQGVQIIGHDGRPNQMVSVTTIPLDQTPIRYLPQGVYTKTLYMFYFFKAGGGTPTKPIPIIYPNDIGAEPGTRVDLWYYDESLAYDPNSNQWKIYGHGTVTQDGKQIIPDSGVGMPKFCCGATFFSVPTSNPADNPSSPGDSCPKGNEGADPVDLNTGAFKYNITDFAVSSPFPISIQRFYNSQSTNIGPFGRGATIGYNHFLRVSGDSLVYTPSEGGNYIFSKNTDGTYTNTQYPFLSGIRAYNNPDGTRKLVFKNGLTYTFNTGGMLIEQKDSNNNKATITRNPDGNVTTVTDNSGRNINITNTTVNIGGLALASLVTSVTDFANRSVSYSYDGSGRLSAVTDPEGGVTTYSYDGSGRLISITNPKGITEVVNEYDSSGRVSKQTHADGGVYNISYTVAGGMVTETRLTDPNGNLTAYRFNGSRYSTDITDSLGQQVAYNRAVGTNKILSVTDPLGRQTSYSYDANGNTTSITDPAGNVTLYEYEPNFNKPTKITDALGNVTIMSYDTKGNLIEVLAPNAERTTIAYNTNGQPVSVTDALGNVTAFEYDRYGNLTKTTDPLGNSATMQYDMLGRLLKATNPEGKSTSYSYDNLNRITEIIDAMNGSTKFAYDANGNLLTATDAKNQTIAYTYNNRNKPASMTDQLGKVEIYSYDKNDNLVSTIDRKGQTTVYTYDPMNRVTKATYADASTIAYTYDAVGRLTYINDSTSGQIEYIYGNTGCAVCGGALDKVVQEITPLGSISYEYDSIGRRTGMTVAGQQSVNYTYDANSQLTSVVGAGLVPAQIAYDAIGRRTSLTLPNGITTNYSYDNASRLLNLEHLNPLNQILEKISYGYDQNGNRTSMNRLNAPVKLPNPAGNITYNQANQMLTYNDKNITYDENGNMTSIVNSCGTTTYTWDARNRLMGINGYKPDCTPLTASFKYDALGRRIEKTINGKAIQYLYDGADIVQEIENSVVTVNYLRTLNIDEPLARLTPNALRFYQQDALGSVIALTDDTGAVKTQCNYDPFGSTEITGEQSDNPFQYAGRENDGTGLLYERNRYYNFELQRYISQDPIRLAGGDVNFYARVGDNPVNRIDPYGLVGPVIIAIEECLSNPLCSGTVITGGAAIANAIGNAISNAISKSASESAVSSPTAPDPPNRCGKWMCEGNAQYEIIGANKHVIRGGWIVAYGNTESEAALAWKKAVQASAPLGHTARHIKPRCRKIR